MNMEHEMARLAASLNIPDFRFPVIQIHPGSLACVSDVLSRNHWSQAVLVYDRNTFPAAGKSLMEVLQSHGFQVTGIQLQDNEHGEVIADEQSVVQVLAETPNDADVLVAVGTGTIHDIVRFVSHKMNIPFVSVPTAASVDGFVSKGAPLILRGVKRTIQTAAPAAVFADLLVLQAAPRELTAAGFGDMLGKVTSLLDWEISSLIGNEPYSELAASITKQALDQCLNHVESIGRAEAKGIKILMQALIASGLVMQVLDHSRPASGAEHHLSHYWEMKLLERNQRQLLHGAKVAAAAAIITDLYKQRWNQVLNAAKRQQFSYAKAIETYGPVIQSRINQLPSSDQIRRWAELAGGPSTIEQLGLSEELVTESLNEAFRLRDRCTGLFLINQTKDGEIRYSDIRPKRE